MVGLSSSRGDIECLFREKAVRVTDSAFAHMYAEDIDPNTLCSMLNNTIECPKKAGGTPHNKSFIRVCSIRKRQVFSILLVKEIAYDCRKEVYSVVHLKPVS